MRRAISRAFTREDLSVQRGQFTEPVKILVVHGIVCLTSAESAFLLSGNLELR